MSLRVIVEADGGSRGNPGPAGCGAVVRDGSSGEILAERSVGLGTATNNVAEYQGLIHGLRAAVDLGAAEVDARMDSKLVIEQMSGRWRIKHANLQPLAAQAARLVRELGLVHFEWIPRAKNADADRLANVAMDEQAGNGSQKASPSPQGPGSQGSGSQGSGSQDRASRSPESPARSADRAKPEPTSPSWTGATGSPTRLLLLRHGQTAMSVDRRYSGRGDVPLTGLGEHQARAAGDRLAGMDGVVTDGASTAVIASPLTRTRQTAQAVAEATGATVSFHDGLLETDFGAWEGLTFLEAAEQYEQLHRRWLGDPTVRPPNGESLESVFTRVQDAQTELVRRYAGRTVVVVSHVTPIKALLRLGLDVGPSLFYRLHLDLASLSIVDFYPDGNASVRLVNDVSHLS